MDPREYLLNSLGSGPSAVRLLNNNMDPGCLRPVLGKDGRPYVALFNGIGSDGKPSYRKEYLRNANALLKREEWLQIDAAVAWQAKLRLRFWEILRSKVPFTIPNGMGTLSVQHTVADGDADAIISMDGMRKSERTRPVLKTVQVPLPIIHSDGSFSLRQLAVSRKGEMPLDTTNIGLAGRKVGEVLEQLSLGTSASYEFANGTIYGATNFPYISSYTMTSPESGGGYTPKTTVDQLLDMIQVLQGYKYYGPFYLFYSNPWEKYIDGDYSTLYTGDTLGSRIRKIQKIVGMETLDYLSGFKMMLVQMTPDIIQAMSGMDLTTVQWEENAGMEQMFRVMTIAAPRLRADFNGYTGIIVGTATAPTTTTTTTSTTTTTTTTT